MAKSDYPKSTKIEDLVEIQSMESGDFFLTYSKEGKASLLNFKNLIIGLANVSFAVTFNDLLARVTSLEVGLAALTDTVSLMNTTLNGLISSNTTRITALEATVAANYTSLSSQITTINNTLANHATRILGLEQTVARLSTLDITGMVIAIAGATIPSDWIVCDGRELSRSTYSRLFGIIGTLYGDGNGTTTFNVPNMNGKVIVQRDNGSGVAPVAASLGTSGGDDTTSLTPEQNGTHDHFTIVVPGQREGGSFSPTMTTNTGISRTSHLGGDDSSYSLLGGAADVRPSVGFTSTSGLGAPHNNMQPFMTMQFIIRT